MVTWTFCKWFSEASAMDISQSIGVIEQSFICVGDYKICILGPSWQVIFIVY